MLVVCFSIFFSPFNRITYKLEAFNEFFSFLPVDNKHILTEQKNNETKNIVKMSFGDKARLITNIFPNEQLKKLVEKGEKRLIRELDIFRIAKELDILLECYH